MPDFRQSGSLDDFQRAPENPLSDGGNWSSTASDTALWVPCNLTTGFHATCPGGSVSSDSFWQADTFDRSAGTIEVWGLMGGGGGGAAGTSWAIDFWQNAGGASAVDGYRVREENAGGPAYTALYRVDNANFIGIAPAGPSAGGDGNLLLLRLFSDGTIEVWGGGPGSAGVLLISTTDNTYTGAFNPAIGIRDNSASSLPFFTDFGGGSAQERHTRIIRWVKN